MHEEATHQFLEASNSHLDFKALTHPAGGGVPRPSPSPSWSRITAGRLADSGTDWYPGGLLNNMTAWDCLQASRMEIISAKSGRSYSEHAVILTAK